MALLASPTHSQSCLSDPLKYFKHMTDFCYYKALTIHQLIQFRTPALPYCTDRHRLTVLSGGIRPAALNALQDYTLHGAAAKSSTELLPLLLLSSSYSLLTTGLNLNCPAW